MVSLSYFRYCLLACALLCGCMETEKEPSGLIPQARMREILTDMHYADAYAFQEFRGDSIYRSAAGMYLEIFDKYKIDTATFNKSFRYYARHPKLLDKMYQTMIDSLSARESRLREAP